MSKILNLRSSKITLLQVDGEAVKAAEVDDTVEVKLMINQGARENQNIIQVDGPERKIPKDSVYHPLKHLSSISEAEREAEKLKEAKGGDDGGLWDVCRAHWDLEITLLKVKFRKKPRTSCPGGKKVEKCRNNLLKRIIQTQ